MASFRITLDAMFKNSTLLFALLLALPCAAPLAFAQGAPAARQDGAALRKVAEQYLQAQSAGLPGKVTVKMGAVDPRLSLAACPAPEAFQQPGARPWGKTTVGVRCTAPVWNVFLQAQVSVLADYVTAAVPLAQGQTIDAGQLTTEASMGAPRRCHTPGAQLRHYRQDQALTVDKHDIDCKAHEESVYIVAWQQQ